MTGIWMENVGGWSLQSPQAFENEKALHDMVLGHPDGAQVQPQLATRLGHRDHRGVVRPDAAVHEVRAVHDGGRQERRSGRRREREVDYRDVEVAHQPRAARRPEHVDLATVDVVRRDHEHPLRVAKPTVAEHLTKCVTQWRLFVARPPQPTE